MSNKDNLTRAEAIQAMKEGKKVSHRYFTPDEFIYMEGDTIHTEDGAQCSSKEFWSIRSNVMWEIDWNIYPEKAIPAPVSNIEATEGEGAKYYPGQPYQRLFNAIHDTKGIALESDMAEIIRIVHEDFPITRDTIKSLLIETAMRAQVMFPQTEQQLKWFDEEFKNQPDYFIRLTNAIGLPDIDGEIGKVEKQAKRNLRYPHY